MPHDTEIPPGPNAGRVWRDPVHTRRDRLAGRTVHRLTAYRGHSQHVAGRVPCWLDHDRLLVVSDREGHSNLFSCNLVTRALTQLTDLRGGERPALARLTRGGRELGFSYGKIFYELDLTSLRMSVAKSRLPKTNTLLVNASRSPLRRTGKTLLRNGRLIVWISERPAVASRRALLILSHEESRYALTRPCLDPSEQSVVFGADAEGYAQIFAVEIGPLETLPTLSSVVAEQRAKLSATSDPRSKSPRA